MRRIIKFNYLRAVLECQAKLIRMEVNIWDRTYELSTNA